MKRTSDEIYQELLKKFVKESNRKDNTWLYIYETIISPKICPLEIITYTNKLLPKTDRVLPKLGEKCINH